MNIVQIQGVGPIIIDLPGTELTLQDRDLIQNPLVGGVILFSRNFVDIPTLCKLTQDIRAAREKPILIMVDHEGGRVQRFREGFTAIPAASTFGREYKINPESAKHNVFNSANCLASELKKCGIDLNLGPVLDLDWGYSEVIGDRSFAADPHIVAELAKAYMAGLSAAGMNALGKHFPGHGRVAGDSHLMLPRDDRSLNTLLTADLLPFKSMIDAGLPWLMTAHIVFEQVDDVPVTYSAIWLKDILRKQLGFQGVIISDDLFMAGAATIDSIPQRIKAALDAGCDMVILSQHYQELPQILADFEASELTKDRTVQESLLAMTCQQ